MLRTLKIQLATLWSVFWMRRSGLSRTGRLATAMASLLAAPSKNRVALAQRYPQGYVAPSASVLACDVRLGAHVFIGERVEIFRKPEGPPVELGDHVEIHSGTIIEVGAGGGLSVGARTGIQPRCCFSSYEAPIRIGRGVQIAAGCAFYSYDHGIAPGALIMDQPLTSKGPIVIEDDAWLGYGAIVLSGVRIGRGAVVGAGAVVTKSIPDGAVAVGSPARVVKMREEL